MLLAVKAIAWTRRTIIRNDLMHVFKYFMITIECERLNKSNF